MTDVALVEEARALADAATPGPWSTSPRRGHEPVAHYVYRGPWTSSRQVARTMSDVHEDAAFIAASRTLVPALASRLLALSAEVAGLREERALRPMSEAPMTGMPREILVATTNRAGCNGWLIAHYADGGGEEQPRFRGWFFWSGHAFLQIDEKTLLGWLPLPKAKRALAAAGEVEGGSRG